MIRSHFAGDASEQGDIQKAVCKGWCKESRLISAFTVCLLRRSRILDRGFKSK